MRSGLAILAFAAAAAAAGALRAQVEPPPQVPATTPTIDGVEFLVDDAWSDTLDRDDYRVVRKTGGFWFRAPAQQLDVRGMNVVLLSDRDDVRALLERQQGSGLPRRTVAPPAPRRRLTPEQMRERVDRMLRAVGRSDSVPPERISDQQIELLRFLYFEGGVTVVRAGIEVLRCERMWISPLDDRIVVENAELRYHTSTGDATSLLIVRGPRLVKEGGRWTGRDVTLTTCTAAVPHAAAAVGEIEIIERDGEFEVVARGQTLQLSGTSVLPLPDARFFTGSQSEFAIKRARGGYSAKEGAQAEVVFGLPYNRAGGAVHEWLTGRPAHEFRGEWDLGVGWIEQRGVPLRGGLAYAAPGLYEGRTRGFFLDDNGEDLREIQARFDGSPIDTMRRGLVTSENRVHFGPDTHVDLVAFDASDPAVYSEFFPGQYRLDEVPETSVYVHHADDARLLTVGGRWNLDDFSYRDNRALADRFVEELPVITYQWLAQPLGETPWGTPLVVDLETELGQRRSDFDDLAGTRQGDRTFRADQVVELSAPFHLGALNVRPYAAGRGTWYDTAVDGDDEGRIGVEAGVQVGTRLSRTWSWFDEEGDVQSLRHVMAPKLTYRNRFHVDDRTGEFFDFDATDALTERELVRVELRNLLQRSRPVEPGAEADVTPRDFLMLDLAQDFWPDADRDNGGETVGLFYYDLVVRPTVQWLPVETFALGVYGDHDWREGMRTFDTEVQIGPIGGITWTADYREDRVVEGAVGITANTRLLDRWTVYAGSQRDLQRDEWLSYTFGLVRDDHDWSISMSAVYNPFADETTFNLEFLPRFGGLSRGREDRFGGEALRTSSNFATTY